MIKLAAVYTLTYARQLVTRGSQADINVAATHMLEFLGQGGVDFGLRVQVAAALEYLVRVDSKCIILSILQPNYLQLVQAAVDSPDSQVNFDFLALYVDTLGDFGINPSNPLFPFIEKALVPTATLACRVVQYGSGMLQTDEKACEKALMLGGMLAGAVIKFLKKFLFLKGPISRLLFDPVLPQLVNLFLNFALPGNNLDSTLFYFNQEHEHRRIISHLHLLKAQALTILTQSTRLLQHCKEQDPSTCLLITQSPQFLREFVRSLAALLSKTQYYKLASSQIKVCEEICLYLLATLRLGAHFALFTELKQSLVFNCLFKMLAFTPNDYDRYYNDPDEFLNSLLQLIDLTASPLKNQRKALTAKAAIMKGEDIPKADEDEDDEGEDFSNLRTLAGSLLSQIAKYIDGALSELMFYCVSVLDDRINMELSKNLMLVVICILRDDVKDRDDLKSSIGKVLLNEVKELGLPRKSEEEPYSNTS